MPRNSNPPPSSIPSIDMDTDTTNICRRNKNFNLRDTRVEHADRRKNSSSRIRLDQDFWPAGPTSGLATRLTENTSAISAAFHFHGANAFRPPVPASFTIERGRKERVLLARRISRIFVMEGGTSRASSTSGCTANARLRFGHVEIATWTAELERDKGELGWKLGCESIWESNSREDIFFQMDVKVVSFNRLFWECAQFLRCSIRYKCIGQFFEQSPGF